MRKNKKISTENLYFGRIVSCTLIDYTPIGNPLFLDAIREFKLDEIGFTIVRKRIFSAYDIFNNTEYPLFHYSDDRDIAVSLILPLDSSFGSKIRYKDAEKILETFKDIISEKRTEENENNISKVKTKN